MDLIKEEYSALYYIDSGRTDIERLDNIFNDREKTTVLVKKLESLGLIRIEYRDKEIYSFILTGEGENAIHQSKYEEWFNELGD